MRMPVMVDSLKQLQSTSEVHMTDSQPDAVSKKTASMLIRTYALLSKVAYELRYSNHLIGFVGLDRTKANPDLLWGVYGTNSMNSADAYASMEAQHNQRLLHQVDLYYKVPALSTKNTVISEAMVKEGGFYNLDRLEVNFRNALYEQLVDYLPVKNRADYLGESGKTIHDFLRENPMVVHQFMADEPSCMVMTHQVVINGGARLRMATLRKDMSRIERVHVRYHEEIEALV